jgi:hypothetical protein
MISVTLRIERCQLNAWLVRRMMADEESAT